MFNQPFPLSISMIRGLALGPNRLCFDLSMSEQTRTCMDFPLLLFLLPRTNPHPQLPTPEVAQLVVAGA